MKKLALLLVLAAPLGFAQDWMATSFDHDSHRTGWQLLLTMRKLHPVSIC
jgi:hypothetical protein